MEVKITVKPLCVILLVSLSLITKVSAQESSYQLATGDVVSVQVFNESDLSVDNARISDDGTISIPLLGQVNVANMSVSDAEKLITQLFGANYLRKPSVRVSVDEYRPFYINGEVKSPGSYPYRINMTVQIAITIAGGFTERASRQKIFVLKEAASERVSVQLSDTIQPGDIITIEESFF